MPEVPLMDNDLAMFWSCVHAGIIALGSAIVWGLWKWWKGRG